MRSNSNRKQKKMLKRVASIPGWLTLNEAEFLAQCAQDAPEGACVEIGSYHGRSTVAIATYRHVFAIDPHYQHLSSGGYLRIPSSWLEFRKNIKPVQHNVSTLPQLSYHVQWDRGIGPPLPIGMIFIDGEHDAQNVRRDYEHFKPWFMDGAYICFHDYHSPIWPGVNAVVDSLPYDAIDCVGNLIALKYVKSDGEDQTD